MLTKIFDRLDDPKNARAKFQSRLFGIFSERIVEVWAANPNCPYSNLGRPTITPPGAVRGSTLDFTLKDRATGKIYAAEMKCEIEYLDFRYFILEASYQLDHHVKPAFDAFLQCAQDPGSISAKVRGKPVMIDGAVLIWGAISTEAKDAVRLDRGFHDILSVEDICKDLLRWQSQEYQDLIQQYRSWSSNLFDGLTS